MLNNKEKKKLSDAIQVEGFEYCFLDYSDWNEIKDKDFQAKLKDFQNAHIELKKYLETQGIELE